jgi:hypothetical protein
MRDAAPVRAGKESSVASAQADDNPRPAAVRGQLPRWTIRLAKDCMNLGHARPATRAVDTQPRAFEPDRAAPIGNTQPHEGQAVAACFARRRSARAAIWHAACNWLLAPAANAASHKTKARSTNHSHPLAILPPVAHALVGAAACRPRRSGPSLLRLTPVLTKTPVAARRHESQGRERSLRFRLSGRTGRITTRPFLPAARAADRYASCPTPPEARGWTQVRPRAFLLGSEW